MNDGSNFFYWKEIVGTILWIGLIYFLIRMDGWKYCESWLLRFWHAPLPAL